MSAIASVNQTNYYIPNNEAPVSCWQGRTLEWLKRAALTVALAAIAVGIVLLAGITSVITISLVGSAVAIATFCCSLLLFKPVERVTPPVELPFEQGVAYNPETHVDLIKAAILGGNPLTWKGKPENNDVDFWILPNLRLGNFRSEIDEFGVQFKAFDGPRIPAEPSYKKFIGNQMNAATTQFFCLLSCDILTEQKTGLIKYVHHALSENKTVTFTGDSLPNTSEIGTRTCKTRQTGLITVVDASLLAAYYLKEFTKLDNKKIIAYLEKQLNCKYAENVHVPSRLYTYDHPLESFL